ncbi:MAG: hypothetical protein WCJ64_20240, partial [Rhodospirillaceae bacterium]
AVQIYLRRFPEFIFARTSSFSELTDFLDEEEKMLRTRLDRMRKLSALPTEPQAETAALPYHEFRSRDQVSQHRGLDGFAQVRAAMAAMMDTIERNK